MSALIKAPVAARRAVMSFPAERAAKPSDQEVREAALAARIAELEAEIAGIEAALPDHLARARDEGAQAALADRSDAEAKALEQLRAAAAAALDGWRDRLKCWEGLSVGLARAVLEKVFLDSAAQGGRIESAIARRLQRLDSASLVRVRVSGADFSSSNRFSALTRALGPNLEVIADPALESGACIIDLALGEIEVGPNAQWIRIEALLDSLEQEGAER